MALILAAPLLTVARLMLSKGVRQASKKYGPKLIKKTKDYIKKNKIIWDGKKIVKQPKGSTIKTVRPTNKKPTTTKKPDALDKKADDTIKKIANAKDDGERILNNLDKSGTLFALLKFFAPSFFFNASSKESFLVVFVFLFVGLTVFIVEPLGCLTIFLPSQIILFFLI